MSTILLATWSDGVFVLAGGTLHHELAGQPVRGLASDGHGGVLAITGGNTLRRRGADGAWTTIATNDVGLACCVAVAEAIYVGTENARVLRVSPQGQLEPLPGFDKIAGHE